MKLIAFGIAPPGPNSKYYVEEYYYHRNHQYSVLQVAAFVVVEQSSVF